MIEDSIYLFELKSPSSIVGHLMELMLGQTLVTALLVVAELHPVRATWRDP
jgi:hypothetical protein